MWLARLFGGRKLKAEHRPARIAPRISDSPVPPVKRSPAVGKGRLGIHANPVAHKMGPQAKSGFDPYNSGSFERGNAWERVPRR